MYTGSMAKKIVVIEGQQTYVMMEDGTIQPFPLAIEYDDSQEVSDSTQTTEKK
jgi:hypothetical protein